MKMPTYSSVARARLRHARKEYLALAIGVFLSLFLAATACLSIQGVFLAQMQKIRQAIGSWSAYLFDWSDCTDQELRDLEVFDQIGHVYVQASITNTDIHLGYSDQTADRLFPRRVLEGRLPQGPGEIALEQSVVTAAAGETQVWRLGDVISLNLTPVDGLAEQRQFTLVGILADQSAGLQATTYAYSAESSRLVSGFPGGLLSPEEEFSTGRLAVHRIMDSMPGVSPRDIYLRASDSPADWRNHSFSVQLILLSETGVPVQAAVFADESMGINQSMLQLFTILALLFLSLMLSCCVGIAGSMEGILEKRKPEIGILRCLGATRRQIRRMFGREALLLAVLLAPVSVAAGCGCGAAIAHFFPDTFVFRAEPWLLIPIGALGIGAILLCQSLPLLRASRQMPMGVMRDVTMLRRAKGLRSRKQFRLPRLLTRRMLRLYPARPLGAALLAGLTFLCTALLGALISQGLPVLSSQVPAFTISTGSTSWMLYSSYVTWMPRDTTLSSGSLAQLRSLPYVSKLGLRQYGQVATVQPEIPEYFTHFGYLTTTNWFLTPLEELERRYAKVGSEYAQAEWEELQKGYREFKAQYDISGETLYIDFIALEPESEQMRQLQSADRQGTIDLKALNEGRQVLIYFPSCWARVDEDGGIHFQYSDSALWDSGMEKVDPLDTFQPGQALPILQLHSANPDPNAADLASPQWVTRRDATVTVGAVVTEPIRELHGFTPTIITTTSGLESMGLVVNGRTEIDVYVDEIPEEDQAKALARQVEAIALRAKDSTVSDHLNSAREEARFQLQSMALFACLVALFFTLSAANLLTGVSRQIMADGQRLGMLRAVGADEKTLLGCYSGQIAIAILGGVVLSVLGIAAIDLSQYLQWRIEPTFLPTAWGILPVAALNWGLCRLLLSRKIRELTRRSVILTIREL